METITYNLKNGNVDSTNFYKTLSGFTDWIFYNKEYDVTFYINKYIDFIKQNPIEKVRSKEEYFLEYLTMGVLINQHSGKALNSLKIYRTVSKRLLMLRKKYHRIKTSIDWLRGFITTTFLTKEGDKKSIQSVKEFYIFVDWLKATGEYWQEANRMQNWNLFVQTLYPHQLIEFIEKSKSLAMVFEMDAANYLGKFTCNVNSFISGDLLKYKYKENYLFCGKAEIEYHLNMVGAEILNRRLKEDFNRTSKKILLLPVCMCKPKDGICKSVRIENKIFCTGCTVNCPVNISKKHCNEKGIGINLIPHSSSFSKYLKEWQGKSEVGLIGTGCVLNLLSGGYEMINLNIPSQCIFLDYCGCKKHWHKEGITTNIDLASLDKMLLNEEVNAGSAESG